MIEHIMLGMTDSHHIVGGIYVDDNIKEPSRTEIPESLSLTWVHALPGRIGGYQSPEIPLEAHVAAPGTPKAEALGDSAPGTTQGVIQQRLSGLRVTDPSRYRRRYSHLHTVAN